MGPNAGYLHLCKQPKSYDVSLTSFLYFYIIKSFLQSACVLIELSSLASRLSQAALWAAAVAAEAHAALYARSPARCLLDAEALHRYVAAARRHDDSTANRVSYL